MAELVFRGRRVKEYIEERKKNYLPFGILGVLLLLLLVPIWLWHATPENGIPDRNGNGELFSCRPSFDLSRAPSFAIDTNSTINSFNLDTRSRVVTVNVQGPDSTSGLFCINVPKATMGERLRTTVDNIPVDARTESYEQTTIVSLSYHHSEREIRIIGDLGPPPEALPTEPSPTRIISGMTVIFSPDERPEFTREPDAGGMRVQAKTRASVNFLSTMGNTVGIAFKVDNLSTQDTLVRVKMAGSDSLLIDVMESSDIDVVRAVSGDEFVIRLRGEAARSDLVVHVTPLASGMHTFFMELQPVFDQQLHGIR